MIKINTQYYQQLFLSYAANLKDLRVIGLLVFLVIVLLVSWSGVKAIDTNYGLQKQISKLEQQNAVQHLSNENLKLQNDYYQTPQYLDVAARQNFGLAAPGETVLVVPRNVALMHTVDLPPTVPSAIQKQQAKKPAYRRNFQTWMDFLLHRQQTTN